MMSKINQYFSKQYFMLNVADLAIHVIDPSYLFSQTTGHLVILTTKAAPG